MNKVPLIGLICALICLPLYAQTAASSGVEFPTNFAAWVVLVKENKEQNKAAAPNTPAATSGPRLVRINTVQTPTVRSDTFLWTDGKSSQNWSVNGIVLSENVQNRSIYILASQGFLGLSNGEITLDPSLFVWTQGMTPVPIPYNGQPSLLYKRDPRPGIQNSKENTPGITLKGTLTEAVYVSPSTHLPIAYLRNNRTYEFTFEKPPATELKIPPRFSAKYDRFKLYHPTPPGSSP
jgi:hypothetical protein